MIQHGVSEESEKEVQINFFSVWCSIADWFVSLIRLLIVPKFSSVKLQWEKIFWVFSFLIKQKCSKYLFYHWYSHFAFCTILNFEFFLFSLFWYFDHLTFGEIYFSEITNQSIANISFDLIYSGLHSVNFVNFEFFLFTLFWYLGKTFNICQSFHW